MSWLERQWNASPVVRAVRRPTSPAPMAPLRQTRLDRVLNWVSPSWGAKRIATRMWLQAVQAYYDGADIGRRGASLRRRQGDPNVITATSLPTLREHSRDLVRNNAHARRASEAIVANVIGRGILPHFVRNGKRAEDLERLADAHLETTLCDADGRHTYGGLQSLAKQTTVDSGEALIRRRWRRAGDRLPVPVQFQVLEPDFLDHTKDGPVEGGGYIVQGVEFDAIGRRRQYWLYDEHPGGRRWRSIQSHPVPAHDIAHVYRMDRPGQVRGVPWAAPVILAHADFHDYEDAQLVRQKIAACFAAFITEPFDTAGGLPNTARRDDDGRIIDSFEPGMVERLLPGQEVSFGNPPRVEGYGEYSNITLHKIAMGWGVSYEVLSGDLRGVNFSSGKMGRIEFERNIDRWREHIVYPQICGPLMAWWLEAAALTGANVAGVSVRHVAPRREMIDPPREGRAERDMIRAGQKTLYEVIRERGRDPEKHLKEIQEGWKLVDELGIILDSDPRTRTNAGLTTQEAAEAARQNGDDEAAAIANLLEQLEGTLARDSHAQSNGDGQVDEAPIEELRDLLLGRLELIEAELRTNRAPVVVAPPRAGRRVVTFKRDDDGAVVGAEVADADAEASEE